MIYQPQTYNNPFALIDLTPSPWKGLVGVRPNGFLIFDSPTNGIRAGFINLINAYIKRGLNTIEKIFPVYAPSGHGANIPEDYIKTVVRLTGIPRNKKITTKEEIYKIGKAIVTHEEGIFWTTLQDFNNGYALAMKSVNVTKYLIGGTIGTIILILLLTLIYTQ